MSSRTFVAHNLATAFLSGPWSLKGMLRRGVLACGENEPWLRPLARRVLAAFDTPDQLQRESLTKFIDADRGFIEARAQCEGQGYTPLRQVFCQPPSMAPVTWAVPVLPTAAVLAEWLGLGVAELDWFANCHGHRGTVPAGSLRHYAYRWIPKRRGKWRLLEVPKSRLKYLQRRLLHGILNHIPPHEAVHSYRKGRSVATFVAPHACRKILLRFDLQEFFTSIRASRVHALFRTAGYPPTVARLLAGLCTNIVPPEIFEAQTCSDPALKIAWNSPRFGVPHLPQGAPTSPALANLCAYRLDCRLDALAKALGACYTRYADDLGFSGGAELERGARRFQVLVGCIALEEGFEVNMRKSRFMRQGVCQQLAGVVLNTHPNLRRRRYDRLKEVLHNCAVGGPNSQNRENHHDFRAHLLGQIGYLTMINRARGSRLREMFDRILWHSTD